MSGPHPLPWGTPALTADIEAMAEALRSHQHVLVAAHMRPDGDAIGSTLGAWHALRAAGVHATPYNPDPVPDNLRFLPGAQAVQATVPDGVDAILALDCGYAHRLGETLEQRCAEGATVYCLDHHVRVDPDFARIVGHDPRAPACAELVYRLVVALGVPLSMDIAKPLFAALHTDTGSFRYGSTRAETLDLGRILLSPGFDVWEVCSELYESHPPQRVRLLPRVLETLRLSACGRFASLTIAHDVVQDCAGDDSLLAGVIHFARSIRGVEVATQMTEDTPGHFRVSFRSRGRVDVSRIAERLGGGGHRNAAACTLSGDLDTLRGDLERSFAECMARTEA